MTALPQPNVRSRTATAPPLLLHSASGPGRQARQPGRAMQPWAEVRAGRTAPMDSPAMPSHVEGPDAATARRPIATRSSAWAIAAARLARSAVTPNQISVLSVAVRGDRRAADLCLVDQSGRLARRGGLRPAAARLQPARRHGGDRRRPQVRRSARSTTSSPTASPTRCSWCRSAMPPACPGSAGPRRCWPRSPPMSACSAARSAWRRISAASWPSSGAWRR